MSTSTDIARLRTISEVLWDYSTRDQTIIRDAGPMQAVARFIDERLGEVDERGPLVDGWQPRERSHPDIAAEIESRFEW